MNNNTRKRMWSWEGRVGPADRNSCQWLELVYKVDPLLPTLSIDSINKTQCRETNTNEERERSTKKTVQHFKMKIEKRESTHETITSWKKCWLTHHISFDWISTLKSKNECNLIPFCNNDIFWFWCGDNIFILVCFSHQIRKSRCSS
jgi:hypothetical protein